MAISDTVKGLLAMRGKRQIDLANYFGMSKQTMNNKIARNSWFASDLVKVAELCECKLGFILPNGQQIFIDNDDKRTNQKETPSE